MKYKILLLLFIVCLFITVSWIVQYKATQDYCPLTSCEGLQIDQTH